MIEHEQDREAQERGAVQEPGQAGWKGPAEGLGDDTAWEGDRDQVRKGLEWQAGNEINSKEEQG